MNKIAETLKKNKIRPTMTRIAVAKVFFENFNHPSAEELLIKIQKKFPYISRATVYNTMDLFVKKGLAKKRAIKSGRFVYDPVVSPHHHFVDKISGKIYDISWDVAKLPQKINVPGFKTEDYYLVIVGKKIKEGK